MGAPTSSGTHTLPASTPPSDLTESATTETIDSTTRSPARWARSTSSTRGMVDDPQMSAKATEAPLPSAEDLVQSSTSATRSALTAMASVSAFLKQLSTTPAAIPAPAPINTSRFTTNALRKVPPKVPEKVSVRADGDIILMEDMRHMFMDIKLSMSIIYLSYLTNYNLKRENNKYLK